jgi:hypothetical protein
MKKIVLLIFVTLTVFISKGQEKIDSIIRKNNGILLNKAASVGAINNKSNYKTTALKHRRYDHEMYSESISTVAFDGAFLTMWQDTTMLEIVDSVSRPIRYSSVAQTIYPFDSFWNDRSNPSFLGLPSITKSDNFQVDSVGLLGYYAKGTSAASAIVDTLLISVTYQPYTGFRYWVRSTNPWVAPYLPITRDTLYAVTPFNFDGTEKVVLGHPISVAGIKFKVPLTASMRNSLPILVDSIREFNFALPTPLLVPAGNGVNISYTFISGDSWKLNDDTITNHHHFLPLFAYPKDTVDKSLALRQKNYFFAGDKNMSSILTSQSSLGYQATLILGAMSDSSKWFNQYLVNHVALSCSFCSVGVEAINEKEFAPLIDAYPVPTNETLHISIKLAKKSNVTVTILNILGQTLASQIINSLELGQEKTVSFNTSELASGVYIYSVELNGQKFSKSFAVKH